MTVSSSKQTELPGESYIHGLRADDGHWSSVWNFSLAGTRTSVGVLNAVEEHAVPEEVDIEVLQGLPSGWPPMFMSGLLSIVWQGAIVRNGLKLGQGVPPHQTHWATEEWALRMLRAADRELALEMWRREHGRLAPSRLSCIWLAENTVDGRNLVHDMIGEKSFLMQVDITLCVRIARCDAHWLDQVASDPTDTDAIAGYWSGRPQTDNPLWEYLLEGQITSNDADELQSLREFIHLNGPPKDLIAPQ
jgi:hypothetical protein